MKDSTYNWLNTEIFNGAVPYRLSEMTKICEKGPQKHYEYPETGFLLHFQKAKKVSIKTLIGCICQQNP